MRDLSDLEHVATTDKALLRTVPQPERLIGNVPAGSRTLETSGTSGEAFEVHYGPRAAWWQGVLRLRSTRRHGLQPWHRTASLTLRTEAPRTEGIAGRCTAFAAMCTCRPTSTLTRLARRVFDARPGRDLRTPPPARSSSAMRCTATCRSARSRRTERRSRPRRGPRSARCSVPNRATATALPNAASSPRNASAADLYHVNHEAVVVELLDDDDQPVPLDETGSIALTSMWNPLMPFVRYRIGDSAVFAQRSCRCGSALPALTSLSGRTMNWIVDANGSRVAPQRMWVSLYLGDAALLGISRYRVQQDESRRVTIELVADLRFGDDLVSRWISGYRTVLGDVPIEFRRVDHIEIRPEEKFEIISSRAVPVG